MFDKPPPSPRRRVIPYLIFCLFLLGFLFCCSGIEFPFLGSRFFLNRRLKSSFELSLPASATVTHSYWVALRDPENVFAVDMAPQDLPPFIEAISRTAMTRKYSLDNIENPDSAKPMYRIPPWWNNPPLPNPLAKSIFISATQTHFTFLYSPTAHRMYIVWDEI